MSLITETEKSYFYQWDTNQVLIVEDEPNCREVHFGYRDGSFARVCQIREEDGRRVVDIPNELLQKDRTFFVYPISEEEDDAPMRTQSFVVLLRPKPDDYVHTEPEMQTYEALEERITALEENGCTGGSAIKTVNGVAPDESGNVEITIQDEYVLPVAGKELGGVKNGGNITVNADGTMTAPESAGGEDWEELASVRLEEEALPIVDIGDYAVNFKKLRFFIHLEPMTPTTVIFALSIPNATTGMAYTVCNITNFGDARAASKVFIEFEPLIEEGFCHMSYAWATLPTVNLKGSANQYQYNSYDYTRLETARYFRSNIALPAGTTIAIKGVRA